MIRAENVGFEYLRRDSEGEVIEVAQALKDVSLHVKPGSFVVVIGANGSGKSTFAKHLSALLTPGEGRIIVDGMDTRDKEAELQIRQTAGMVFQNPDNQLVSGIVEEDVGFGPENIGIPTEEIWQRVAESLKSVGMYAYRQSSTNQLSGGQKQRVAIAGILAMRPQCIVLDEPTAMLDPRGRQAVLETLHRLNKEEQITIILITHYMEETVGADYVYLMRDGEIVTEGGPREIFMQAELLEECRLCVPEITKIAIRLGEEGVPVPPDILTEQELAHWLIRWKKQNG